MRYLLTLFVSNTKARSSALYPLNGDRAPDPDKPFISVSSFESRYTIIKRIFSYISMRFFQSADLCLTDPDFIRHLHLGLSFEEPHGQDMLFSAGELF